MNTQLLHRLLYALKRQWGTTFDYVQIQLSEVDNRTGTRRIQRQVLYLPAVQLPQNQLRKFIQDIGYLAADKNFTYGALNDFNTLTLLVDTNDLPVGFQPELNGYIIHGMKRYERFRLDNLADAALLISARGVEGSFPFARVEELAVNNFTMQQRIDYELN